MAYQQNVYGVKVRAFCAFYSKLIIDLMGVGYAGLPCMLLHYFPLNTHNLTLGAEQLGQMRQFVPDKSYWYVNSSPPRKYGLKIYNLS